MNPIYEELKARVLEAEQDPAVDTGRAAMALPRRLGVSVGGGGGPGRDGDLRR